MGFLQKCVLQITYFPKYMDYEATLAMQIGKAGYVSHPIQTWCKLPYSSIRLGYFN